MSIRYNCKDEISKQEVTMNQFTPKFGDRSC